MKSIVFRPLRLNKQLGKIVVASYKSWRNVKTADYNDFKLTIDDEYKQMPTDALVYDHQGEELFWLDFDPDQIPVFTYTQFEELFDVADILKSNERYAIDWVSGYGLQYCSPGLDCDGVPTFSNNTADHLVILYQQHITKFKPLTVGVVVKWFGWFLYQLEKTQLQIGK